MENREECFLANENIFINNMFSNASVKYISSHKYKMSIPLFKYSRFLEGSVFQGSYGAKRGSLWNLFSEDVLSIIELLCFFLEITHK